MCVSPPSRSFFNWRIVSQLHPSPISPYLRLKMCISTQTRSHLNPIQVSRFVSHLHPGSPIHASSLSHLNLTSIWVLIFTSHLHPGNPVHVSRCASQLNPGPIPTPSRSRDLCLLSTQAPRFTFLLCPT